MLESIKSYPLLYGILVLMLGLCLFAWIKAAQVSRRRQAEKDTLIAELEREKALRREFETPVRAQIESSPPEKVLDGMRCYIQVKLERAGDAREAMEAAFYALPEPQRLVYALGVAMRDSDKALSDFFRLNGQPVTGAATEAARTIVGGAYAEVFRKEYDAFDEDNESASLIKSEIASLDARFRALEESYQGVKNYVLSNFDDLTL